VVFSSSSPRHHTRCLHIHTGSLCVVVHVEDESLRWTTRRRQCRYDAPFPTLHQSTHNTQPIFDGQTWRTKGVAIRHPSVAQVQRCLPATQGKHDACQTDPTVVFSSSSPRHHTRCLHIHTGSLCVVVHVEDELLRWTTRRRQCRYMAPFPTLHQSIHNTHPVFNHKTGRTIGVAIRHPSIS